jgi:hypothetical protein
MYFSFICIGRQFSIVGTEGSVKVRPGLVLRHYGNQDVTWSGVVECLVLYCTL